MFVDPYLLLHLCWVDMLDTVDIRVATGLFDGSRRSVSFLKILSVVPGNVSR